LAATQAVSIAVSTQPSPVAPVPVPAPPPPAAFSPTEAVVPNATVTQPSAMDAPTQAISIEPPASAIPVVEAAPYAATQAMTLPVNDPPAPPGDPRP
jgi:hypothetical protein